MFDIGMSELLLIGIVALIVVGPKDLPALFHTLGRFTAKMRSLGREFTNAMNAAARESGMDDVAKGLKGVANPKKFGLDKLTEAADRFDKWEPGQPKAPAKAPEDPERAADVEKIRAATEKAGQARLDREAAAKAKAMATDAKGGPADAATPAAKPASKPAAKAAAKPAASNEAPAKKAPTKAMPTKTAIPKAAKPKTAKPKTAAAKPAATRPATTRTAKARASAAKPAAAKPATAKSAKAAAPKADDA